MAAKKKPWPRRPKLLRPELWGVRTYAVAAATATMAIVLMLAGTGLLLVMRSSLLDNAQALAVAQKNIAVQQIQADDSRKIPAEIAGSSTEITQIISQSADILSSSDPEQPLIYDGPVLAAGETYSSAEHSVSSLFDFDDYLIAAEGVQSRDGTVIVAVGTPTTIQKGAITTVGWSLLTGIPLLLALAATLIWVLVGRALRPVETIRSTVAGISHDHLSQRVQVLHTNDEIERLALTMNEMLQRIEAGDEVQRRFVADASHELRSPLATLTTGLEVAIADPSGKTWSDTASMLHKQTHRMSYLVEDLMTLAKIDDAGLNFLMEDVDLDDVLLEEAVRLKAMTRHHLSVKIEPIRITGDPNRLAQVFRNVLNNADRHAESEITIDTALHHGLATVTIDNDGDTVPEDEVERIFDRFVRLDASRSRESGGSGLGLAISREILSLHSGSIHATRSSRGRTRFIITLPAHPPEAAQEKA